MSKKRSRTVTFGEVVAELPRVEEQEAVSWLGSPVAERGFIDAEGRKWTLTRGPIDPRRAKRLAVTADLMSVDDDFEEGGQRVPVRIREADRPAYWLKIKPGLNAPDRPGFALTYQAYEFTSVDGLTLVHFEVYC